MPLQPPVAPAARHAIDTAFKALEKAIAPGDALDFSDTTLEDVRAAAVRVEAQMSTRASLRNMTRLIPLFTGLEHYANVMDVLCNGTPYLPWLWAPIKLVLRIASEYVEAFNELISAYARLAEAMPRIQLLNRAFARSLDFQKTMAVYYSDILTFHGHAYKFVYRRGWRLLFKTSLGRFEHCFSKLLEDMRHHERLVDLVANAHHISASEEERAANSALRDKLNTWLEESKTGKLAATDRNGAAQFATVMAWLKADDAVSDQMSLFNSLASDGARFPGTFSWLSQNNNIKSWLDRTPDPSLLSIEGTLGVGKSVLAAQLVAALRTDGKFAVCHFCSYGYASSITFGQVLRSFILQVLRRDPELVAFTLEEYVRKIREPTVSVLQEILMHLVASLGASVADPGQLDGPGRPASAGQPEHIWIVLDGLDECSFATQASIVNLVRQLLSAVSSSSLRQVAGGQGFGGHGQAAGVTCKVLITSRPAAILNSRLRRGVLTIPLSEEKENITGAIRKYTQGRLKEDVGDRLDQLHVDPARFQGLVDAIVTKADGMFLYARLQINCLATNLFYTGRELPESVDELPAELALFYRNVLDRILGDLNQRSSDRLRCFLGWITFSKRPLKRLELISALTFSQGDPEVEHLVPRYVLDIIAPFIVERNDMTIGFVHVSVRDFLQSPMSPIRLSKTLANHEHSIATATCLLAGVKLLHSEHTTHDRFQRLVGGIHGLHVYATEYWAEHLLAYVTSLADGHADGHVISPDGDRSLDLALRLAHCMENWLQSSIGLSTGGTSASASAGTTIATNTNFGTFSEQGLDKRLSHLERLPSLHRCIVTYLRARSVDSLKKVFDDEGTGHNIPRKKRQRMCGDDSTRETQEDGITALLASYQASLRALLDLPDFPGISATQFQLFKREFYSARYTCRLGMCPRSTAGFDTAILRREHEQVHLTCSYYCTNGDCYLSFISAFALNEHIGQYHTGAKHDQGGALWEMAMSTAMSDIQSIDSDDHWAPSVADAIAT